MKDHHLSVYESPGPDRTTPQIRLQGKWLAQLGFEVGEKIVVSYEDGKLIIQLEPIIPANNLQNGQSSEVFPVHFNLIVYLATLLLFSWKGGD